MMMSIRTWALLSAATLLPVVAHAQDQQPQSASADAGVLQDIIVTAQKRAEPLQSVPVAVSAFNSETLERARLDNLTGLRGLVPGLTINRSGASMDVPQLSLRGISIQDVLPSLESSIGFTVDGIPIAFQRGSLMDAYDIERIEVLRGPQGVLNGKNTTGGTINVIRARPDPSAEATGKARFTIGSFGENDYEGVIMAPIVSDILAVKGAITVRKNNGQFRNIVTGGRNGDRDVRTFGLAFVATPSDKLNLYLSLDRVENDSDLSPYSQLLTPNLISYKVPGYFAGANSPCLNPYTASICTPFTKSKNVVESRSFPGSLRLNALTGEISYQATDDVRLVSLTGLREFKEYTLGDYDSTRFALARNETSLKAHQFSQELRLETSLDGPFNIVGGFFYMNYEYTQRTNLSVDLAALPPIATGLPDWLPPGFAYLNSVDAYVTNQHNRSTALFFQADYDLSDRLRLTVGGRQTWDRKRTHYTLYTAVPGTVRDMDALGPLAGDVAAGVSFQKFTPKVNVQYKFSPDILTYATYSRGYNTGGFSGRTGNLATAVLPYRPEVMDAFEVGFKSEFFDHRVRLNVAAFHNILNDKQENVLQVIGSRLLSRTLNVAKAKYTGVETELTIVPSRNWTILATGGYLHAKYSEFMGNLGQGDADMSVLSLRRTPKWTAGLVSDYSFDAGNGKVGLNGALYYTSRYETDALNDPRGSIPPVARMDLGIRYELPISGRTQLELSGFVRNVTNNTTYDGITSGESPGSLVEFANPMTGRTWGLSLGTRF
ncbi:TonB-dependent receptor [Sphingobium sp. ZW T5_29]|uniref:TonB-dependent receptor n=1 Tax=Sphingobium sp. ZW T5_29 TaxID=3378077 RepID=UPI0038548E55